MTRAGGIGAWFRDGLAHQCHGTHFYSVCDADVTYGARCTSHNAIPAYLDTASDRRAATDYGVIPYLTVMPDLNLIVDLYSVTYPGIIDRASIDSGTCPYFYIVSDAHTTQLMNLYRFRAVEGKSESICTDDRRTMNDYIVTHYDVMVERDVVLKATVIANLATATYEAVRINFGVRAYADSRLDDSIGSDIDRICEFHLITYDGGGVHTRRVER